MKPMANRIDEIFSDGKPHLFGLVLLPDNSYKILIDHKVIFFMLNFRCDIVTDIKPIRYTVTVFLSFLVLVYNERVAA